MTLSCLSWTEQRLVWTFNGEVVSLGFPSDAHAEAGEKPWMGGARYTYNAALAAIKRKDIKFSDGISALQRRFVGGKQNARTSGAPDPRVGELVAQKPWLKQTPSAIRRDALNHATAYFRSPYFPRIRNNPNGREYNARHEIEYANVRKAQRPAGKALAAHYL